MLAALDTSRGKIPDCRMLWIGTRPAHEDHPFERMLAGGADYRQVHAARKGKDAPFKLATWRRANPSLEYFPDLKATIKKEAARAKKDADRLASFEALRLNMGTADVVEQYVLGPDAWAEIGGQDADRSGPWALGVDCGENAAMTAAAAYWPNTGRLEAMAVFSTRPGLLERGQRDGCRPAVRTAGGAWRAIPSWRSCGVYPWTPGPGAGHVGRADDHSLRHLARGEATGSIGTNQLPHGRVRAEAQRPEGWQRGSKSFPGCLFEQRRETG